MRLKCIAGLIALMGCALWHIPAAPAAAAPSELAKKIAGMAEALCPELEPLYKDFHTNPELSLREEKTSARLAADLAEAGFKVTRRVGGYGVVGVLSNGTGPTVLLRTDMDALPVTEQTDAPYASSVKV